MSEKQAPIDATWNGETLAVPDVLMAKYRAKYSRLDIPSVVIDVEQWLLRNPAKAAGYKSFGAFLNNWLRKEDGKLQPVVSSSDDYEASPEDIAIWEEFGRQNAAKRAAND